MNLYNTQYYALPDHWLPQEIPTVAVMLAALLTTVACSEGSLRRLRMNNAVMIALVPIIALYAAAWQPRVAHPGSKYSLHPDNRTLSVNCCTSERGDAMLQRSQIT